MLKLELISRLIAFFMTQAGNQVTQHQLDMTPALMREIVAEVADIKAEQGNAIQFTFQQVPIALFFDANADRMRLISPIAKLDELADGDLERALEANFHSVLDCRYAISQGQIWSAFIHPMSDLSPTLLQSAIEQVAISRITFGKQFTSGAIAFGGLLPNEAEEPAEDAPKKPQQELVDPEENKKDPLF